MFKKHRQDLDLSWTFTYDVTFYPWFLPCTCDHPIQICFEKFN